MNPEKDEELFCKRIYDLARKAYTRGICMYSSFINLNELSLFYKTIEKIPQISYQLSGGYQEAERRVICLYDSDSFANISFPIACIAITPGSIKYSEHLNHRDYLGAILNLGIERCKVGDIVVKDNMAYVFCIKEIAPFISESIERIRHTNVKAKIVDGQEICVDITTEPISGTVTSVRLDSLLSVAFKTSRSSLSNLTTAGKVFVNGKLVLSNSYVPKEDDIISVRGMGRFIFKRIEAQTKKNRYRIVIEKYV